jgi:PAS domain S-box-containing protein
MSNAESALDDNMHVSISQSDSLVVDSYAKMCDYYMEIDRDSALKYSKRIIVYSNNQNYKLGTCIGNYLLGKVYYYDNNYTEALKYFDISLSIANRNSFIKESVDAYYYIGMTYLSLGDYDNALLNFNQAVKLADDIGYNSKKESCYNAMGIAFKKQGNYGVAMKYYLMSLEIAEQEGDSLEISNVYISIGLIYKYQEKYDEALKYYFKSEKIANALNNNRIKSKTYGNIGVVYRRLKKYDIALCYLDSSLKLADQIGSRGIASSAYTNKANVYRELKDYDNAIDCYNKSVSIKKEINDNEGLAIAYLGLGEMYLQLLKYDIAIDYSLRAYDISSQIGILEIKKDASKILMTAYNKKGDTSSAFKYSREYIEAQDSILAINGFQTIVELEKKYNKEKTQILIDKLKKENELEAEIAKRRQLDSLIQKRQKYLLIVSLIILFAITLFITWSLRKKKRMNARLMLQKSTIEKSEAIFKAITDSANDAIILVDNSERIILWNNAAYEIFGYSADEIIGKNVHDILPLEKYRNDAHNSFASFRNTGKGKALNNTLELEALRKGGAVIPIELSLSAIEIEGKWNAVGVIRDISKRKVIEKELIESRAKIEDVVRQFEETIENLEDVYFKTDKSFIYQQVSPSAIKHLNLNSLEEIVGEPLTKFWSISKEDRNKLMILIRKERVIKDYLIEFDSLSGERKYGRVNARAIVKENSFYGIEGIIRDVTKQVNSEVELKNLNDRLNKNYLDSVKQNLEIAAKNKEIKKQVEIIADKNRQFENAINNIEDVYFKTDRKLVYRFVSPSILRHLGLDSVDQVVGKPLMEFWVISEQESRGLALRILRRGVIKNLPIEYKTISGDIRYAMVNATSIFINGVFEGVEGIIRDITNDYLNNIKIQELNYQKEILLNNIPAHIFYKDINLRYIEVNQSFAKLIGVSASVLIGKSDADVLAPELSQEYEEMDREVIRTKKPIYNRVKFQKDKNGDNQWISTTKIPFLDINFEVSGIIGVVRDITSQMEYEEGLLESKMRIEEAHTNMLDNINYARTIQQALLTSDEMIKQCIFDLFVLYLPKERVSGDFYYIKKIKNYLIFAAADCTGHGVSGAFLTMLGITYLHDISNDETIDSPAKALDALRKKVKTTFASFGSDNHNGLDIALCSLNLDTYELEYAGAYNPLFIVRDGNLKEYKATRNPIGFYPKEVNFENHKIQLRKNDTLYLFSDGYSDQMGGEKKKKLKIKRFKEIIVDVSKQPINQQKNILSSRLDEWKGDEEQTDDIVVLGLKI